MYNNKSRILPNARIYIRAITFSLFCYQNTSDQVEHEGKNRFLSRIDFFIGILLNIAKSCIDNISIDSFFVAVISHVTFFILTT